MKKHLLHTLHWCGFSPVCVLACVSSDDKPVWKFSYINHIYVAFHQCVLLPVPSICVLYIVIISCPVCVDMCLFRLPASEKHFLHIKHWYGFSPVCVRMCLFRWPVRVKVFLHTSHSCSFSPVCVNMCCLRLLATEKHLLHSLQDRKSVV